MEGPAVAFEAALCELTDLIELQDLGVHRDGAG